MPPLAVKTTLPPEQNVVVVAAVIVAVGNALTVTVTRSVLVQPVAVVVPVTVYVVVEEGVNAVAFVTLLSQVYVFAPEPESVTDVPAQTVWSAPALTVGKALTVTVT